MFPSKIYVSESAINFMASTTVIIRNFKMATIIFMFTNISCLQIPMHSHCPGKNPEYIIYMNAVRA